METNEKIKKRRLELGLSLLDVATALNVNKSTVLRYETKDIEKLPLDIIEPLANVLQVSKEYLMGWDSTDTNPPIRQIPLYDFISCGAGGFVDDNIIDYVSLPAEMFSSSKEYFAQYVRGDSMINANINDGDLVIFEKTSSVTNGMIGCFCVDDNIATCKRLSMTNGQIILLPENPSYSPIICDVETFKCIGKLAFVINDRREG